MDSKELSAEYLDYIASDAWRRRRSLKLLLAGGLSGRVQCESCKRVFSVRRVDVHHQTYERFKSEWMSDLRILCRSCHDAVREIDMAIEGGSLDQISDQLLQMLSAIDERLLHRPETLGPIISKPKQVYAECSIEDLIKIIQRKRLKQGIAP